jgi:cell division protein FtsN
LETGRFIKDLLYQADVIRIPALGSFVSTYQNAQTDLSGKKISPPIKYFKFDDTDKADDELVWSWIAEQEGISEAEARNMVTDFVADINHEIHEGREVVIEGLGTFFGDVTGRTEFHFSVENNFHAESLGFSELDLPDATHHKPTIQIEPIIHHTEDIKQVVLPKQEIHVQHTELINTTVHQTTVKGNKSYRAIWITFIVVIIVASLSFLAYQQRSKIAEFAHNWFDKEKSKTSDTLKSKQVADTALAQSLAEKARLQKAAEVKNIDSTKIFIPYGSRQLKYYIVAASFTNYDYAIKLKEELHGKGFESEIITLSHKYYKVTLGSYLEKQRAEVELEKLKTITRNNALWLIHI